MLNVGLGAEALSTFTAAFHRVRERPEEAVTLWHLATVPPLVFHQVSRRAISKRRSSSGLRSILTRDPDNDIAQNEAIFNLNRRLRAMYPRTMRALNCGFAAGLLGIENGDILSLSFRRSSLFTGEAREIVKAAEKLGTWAGQLTSFEYFTVLGLEFHQ
jgi:hypothetical protein